MRKLITFILVLAAVLSLTSCMSKEAAELKKQYPQYFGDKELTDLKPVSAEQMKIILSTYRIDSSKIDICIWQNPISSYIPEDLMGHGGDGPLLAMDYKNKIRRMLSLPDADMPVSSSSSEAH